MGPTCPGPTTTSTTTTTTTTVVAGGIPAANWGNDPSVVAWWPYDGDTSNHSTSTGYCSPPSNANLGLYVQNGTTYGALNFDSVNKKVGTSSFLFNGDTTLAQIDNDTCLRSAQPNQWTFTWWGRVTGANGTASCSPYPFFLFNRDENDNGTCPLCGTYVEYIMDGSTANGRTYVSTHNSTDGTLSSNDFIVYPNGGGGNTWFLNNSVWHFGAVQYDGTNLKYSIDGSNAPGSGAHALGKNPGTYPFQISHDSNSTCHAGVIGNQDDVFWTDQVLSTAQICRLMACGVDGSKCWCQDANTYRPCNTDADCNGLAGACNTNFPNASPPFSGTCVGNLNPTSNGGIAGCAQVSDLPPCGAILTGTTTTAASTTTHDDAAVL
jgi:hypothetical protein